jgi:hypothetical protein
VKIADWAKIWLWLSKTSASTSARRELYDQAALMPLLEA